AGGERFNRPRAADKAATGGRAHRPGGQCNRPRPASKPQPTAARGFAGNGSGPMIADMNRSPRPPATLELSGDGLTLDDAEAILHGPVERLGLAPAARKRVERARRCLDDLIATGATIYGVNTGFGKLSNQRIEADEVLALQENLLRSHAVGMGALLPLGVSRLSLALRIQ